MNAIEKSKYMAEVVEYMEQKRVYSIFEDMYRALAVEQPNDPLAFLIKRLRTTRRGIRRKTGVCGRSAGLFGQGDNPEAQSAL